MDYRMIAENIRTTVSSLHGKINGPHSQHYNQRNGYIAYNLQSLVLSRSQIGKDFRYATLPSASGFDYNAKLSILRAALKKNSSEDFPLMRLEMSDEVLIAQPVELMKGDSKGSVIKVRILPDDMERSIPVSSIFRITVLRWTLS